MSSRLILIGLALPALLLQACTKEQPAEQPANDSAPAEPTGPKIPPLVELIDTTGTGVGRVEMTEAAEGVTLKLTVFRLPAGTHGVHLHEAGRCDTKEFFKSAGAHWNPAGRKHGRENPQGSHLGDLDNIVISGGPQSTTTITLAGVSYGAAQALADADGTSIVIHAKPDDYKTDPSGDSGDRIACAILAPPQSGN